MTTHIKKSKKIQQFSPGVTCIIPFHNEGDRVVQTVAKISELKTILQIIYVDDGSVDTASKKSQSFFQM